MKYSSSSLGPVSLFWWIAHKTRFSDYNAIDGEKFERERRAKRWARIVGAAVMAMTITLAYRSGWRLPILVQMARRLTSFA